MDQKTQQNVEVLANAVELAANIVMSVAGEAVSNTINGVRIPAATLKASLVATMQRQLSKDNGIV